MMDINALKEELMKDARMNIEDLATESVNVPMLYSKWLQFALDATGKRTSLRSKLKRLYLMKRNYYLGRGTAEQYKEKPFGLTVMKNEVQMYIEADPDIRKLEDQLEYQDTLVDFLVNACKLISNKGFNIRDAISFLKFQNGLV